MNPHNLGYDKYESAGYVVSRMTQTYGAISNVLSQISKRNPEYQPSTIIDFGCGPGTAIWASKQIFPIKNAIAIDISTAMLEVAKRFSGFL